ncbi:MAG: hypothetical protein AAF354_02815, partial [Pseudomonadota bacterium]
MSYSILLLLLIVSTATFAKDVRPEFTNPPQVASKDGVLETEFTVAPHTIELGGKTVTTNLYNGLFAPPTLRVRPGDTLKLNLRNRKKG